jgi:ATP-dependent DNA helicase RecQ
VLPARDEQALRELMLEHPRALEEPRQLARFLCGLTSPATSRARLGRHPSFGALAERSFVQVLRLCQRLSGAELTAGG